MASETPLHFQGGIVPYENSPHEELNQSRLTKARGSLLSAVSSVKSAFKLKFRPESTAYKYIGTSSYSNVEVFIILRDFLQPDTALTLDSVLDAMASLLPDDAPLSNEVWSFGVICVELAQQIPYTHSSHQKLSRLLGHLSKSEKVAKKLQLGAKTTYNRPFDRLAEFINERLTEPAVGSPEEFINLNAFIANLYESHVFCANPTYAIWTLHDAFEERSEEGLTRDTRVLVAAQWILWNGQGLFMHIRFPGDVSPEDEESWNPGELYDGEPGLSLHRWRFWKDGFGRMADEASQSSHECKVVSAKAAYLMDAYEKCMTF